MTKQELISIEDRDKFIDILSQAKVPTDKKVQLIRERWQYLYQKYRPEKLKKGGDAE